MTDHLKPVSAESGSDGSTVHNVPFAERPRLAPPLPQPAQRARRLLRLNGSAWLLNRSGASTPGAGALGASQAGVRLYMPVWGRLRLTGRLSRALGKNEQDAAIGLALPIKNTPLSVLAERRVNIRGSRNAFSLTVAAGAYGKPLGSGWTLDAYGQAGIIGARHRDRFADGAASVSHSLLQNEAFDMRVGGLLSASVQPGLSRVDAGPELTVRHGQWRLSASWRQRVGGKADPGSGPGLSLSTNF